ncbi:uncharacterized protein Dsimw501_GD17007 [Drosophila simulans]|nr:uncharacterized protein Dsimw501_GD17007 [Drosophila simulans]
MDIMDIQAVESKLSDVTVTPIPRSQVQNFYNYQQQREQREQQPQIQISAIHHSRGSGKPELSNPRNIRDTAAAAALSLANMCSSNGGQRNSGAGVSSTSSGSNGQSMGLNLSSSQLKYPPPSTSPVVVTTQTSANITTPLTSTASLPSVGPGNGLTKYAQLLAVIEEMGRDIRPTYTGSRSSTERLKRGIVHARILVRECLMETERAARQ